jgi:hypothetical protein
MIQRILNKIESKRGSKKSIEKKLVFLKDFFWRIKNKLIYNTKHISVGIKKLSNDLVFFNYKSSMNHDNILSKIGNEFNGDTVLSNTIKDLVKSEGIKNIVETGTYRGYTTKYFGNLAKKVYTIESNSKFYEFAKAKIDMPKNIYFYLGNSWEVLNRLVIPNIKDGSTLFFLDAHWGNPCPTPLELDIIAKHKIRPFILIHDFKVPNHPELGWDKYHDFEYTFENIRDKLDKIYGKDGYNYKYNSEATGAKRGIIIITPKNCKLKTRDNNEK